MSIEAMKKEQQNPPLRGCRHVLCVILFIFRAKEPSFCPAGHAKAYSRGKKDDNFVRKMNPKGAAYFCISTLKRLDCSTATAMRRLGVYLSKICLAQNGHNT
jgi:hypothetical protein